MVDTRNWCRIVLCPKRVFVIPAVREGCVFGSGRSINAEVLPTEGVSDIACLLGFPNFFHIGVVAAA
jgi:hypothetical protein